MQTTFTTYLTAGFNHIADLGGYDHILFLLALCAIYRPADWRRVVILVTAFTLGHSLTLAMAAFGWSPLSQTFIEFLVPVTIVLTALYNVLWYRRPDERNAPRHSRGVVALNYGLALFFGLIHGLAFSNFFRASLFPGEELQIVNQLLAFNLGVELGQLLIVAVIMVLSAIAFGLFHVRARDWNLFVSGAAFGLALVMAVERLGALVG